MYSILVNPTHAVTGTLAPLLSLLRVYFLILLRFNILFFLFIPSSPFSSALAIGPFILLILYAHCLSSTDPQARTPHLLRALGCCSFPSLILSASPKRSCCLHSVRSVQCWAPRWRPYNRPQINFHLWNRFPSPVSEARGLGSCSGRRRLGERRARDSSSSTRPPAVLFPEFLKQSLMLPITPSLY